MSLDSRLRDIYQELSSLLNDLTLDTLVAEDIEEAHYYVGNALILAEGLA